MDRAPASSGNFFLPPILWTPLGPLVARNGSDGGGGGGGERGRTRRAFRCGQVETSAVVAAAAEVLEAVLGILRCSASPARRLDASRRSGERLIQPRPDRWGYRRYGRPNPCAPALLSHTNGGGRAVRGARQRRGGCFYTCRVRAGAHRARYMTPPTCILAAAIEAGLNAAKSNTTQQQEPHHGTWCGTATTVSGVG